MAELLHIDLSIPLTDQFTFTFWSGNGLNGGRLASETATQVVIPGKP